MKTIFLISLVFNFLSYLNTYSQVTLVEIDLTIIPSHPTEEDLISVISQSIHPYTPCHQTASSVTLKDDTITIHSNHFWDDIQQPAGCESIDTIEIGRLDAGVYSIVYHIVRSYDSTILITDTLAISINRISSVELTEGTPNVINIYPNPATTQLTVKLAEGQSNRHTISIYNLLGQRVLSLPAAQGTNHINIFSLPEGIYLVEVSSSHGKRWAQRIVKKGR